MERADFDAVVRRAERCARARPAQYRLRVVGLGLLGYAYIGLVLAGLVAALALLGYFSVRHGTAVLAKLLIAVLLFIGVVLRALWVRFEPPAGRPLTRAELPRLFALVDEVTARAGAPRPAAVLLTPDLNAAIQQRPRFGPVFGYRNYLVIGLPLLEALSLEEFRAVLAHECGHLSGSHGKASAWVYRVRASWSALATRLEASQHWGRKLFVPFFNWYAPRLQAYSYVMAREQEYAADAVAATVTDAATSAAALVRVQLVARWLDERFWPPLLRAPETSAEPDLAPFSTLAPQLAQGFAASERERWLGAALERDTGTADTHPSLRDRLRALGVGEPRLAPMSAPAAESLLGAWRAALAAEIDVSWRRAVAPWWQREHAARAERRARRTALEARAAAGALSAEEQFELARLYLANDDVERAQPLFEAVLAAAPEHADAHAHLGALLARRDDPAAIGHLEFALRHDAQWTLSAGEILHRQLVRSGRQAEADDLLARMRAFRADAAVARRESTSIRSSHDYRASDADGEARAALAVALAGERRSVRRAWLVARVPAPGHAAIPLLVVERRAPWWRFEASSTAPELVKRLAATIPLPEGAQLAVVGAGEAWLRKRARQIPGAQVFPAERS